MKLLGVVGTSFGCSASGERLVSAAREGDLQEAKALLEFNPRLARYSTFGVRNSPLHYSAAHGHHEIVFLLLESGVDINLRNSRGQTALMQACQFGHWEVVQILILFKANIHKADQLNGGTALHFAAISGHTRCIRLLLTDYIPSIPNFWNIMRKRSNHGPYNVDFDGGALSLVVNRRADGGVTALHMAALHGHFETVQLLLDLGACVSLVTVEDGKTIDLIGAGSSPLHYAACGGNAQCCQLLISRGASLTAKNANGRTPLMVALSWNKNWLEGVLRRKPEGHFHIQPSPYLALPLMSIMNIARECGLRYTDISPYMDPCVVCLERKCTVAAIGCGHEFCTRCALYLCSMNNVHAIVAGPPGSIACPLCRYAVVSFVMLSTASPGQKLLKGTMPLALCTAGAAISSKRQSSKEVSQVLVADLSACIPPLRSSSFRYTRKKFPSVNISGVLCMNEPDTCASILRCPGSTLNRSNSDVDGRRSGLLPLNRPNV